MNVSPEMRANICRTLQSVEAMYGAHILYAIESGSRVWGFESTNSDYDVRFIYRKAPADYLSVYPRSDCIENPPQNDGILDFSGWDVKKTFLLFRKSNPALFEWLHSPIVYRSPSPEIQELQKLSKAFFNPRAGIYHYLHMAEGNYRTYLKGDEVPLKKYFYVLRPILACFAVKETHTVPPVTFDELLKFAPKDFPLYDVDSLLFLKRYGKELDKGPRLQRINDWIDCTLPMLLKEAAMAPVASDSNLANLDTLLASTILRGHVNANY